MDALKSVMQQAVAGMGLQTKRIGTTSENISNSDTPGYRRKLLIPGTPGPGSFSEALVILDQTPGMQTYEPEHPMADLDGYVIGSNVSLVMEMADMRDANRTYEANLNAFQQARTMYKSLIDVLKR